MKREESAKTVSVFFHLAGVTVVYLLSAEILVAKILVWNEKYKHRQSSLYMTAQWLAIPFTNTGSD